MPLNQLEKSQMMIIVNLGVINAKTARIIGIATSLCLIVNSDNNYRKKRNKYKWKCNSIVLNHNQHALLPALPYPDLKLFDFQNGKRRI